VLARYSIVAMPSDRQKLVERILDGHGRASREARRAAFTNAGVGEPVRALIDKVTHHAYRVTDEDIVAAKAAGVTEDEIFELSVCAAVGQSSRQLDAALAALDEATQDTP
jgi:hypothetical protein